MTEINELVKRADAELTELEGVEGRAAYGVPGPDLAAFGGEVDLLIAGSRGYGPWGRLVHGSTSSAARASHARPAADRSSRRDPGRPRRRRGKRAGGDPGVSRPAGERRREMFDNVLVGVDGRQGGRDAIALAGRLAGARATVALANVYGGSYMPSHAVVPGRVREDREAAERLLAEELSRLDIEAEIVARQSTSPARGLHELAEARGTDLLVLGSCHRGAVGRAALGDDARAGLNGAPCALAVAPLGYSADPKPFESIGVAYNATPESELALLAARELAGRTGARIRALNVVTAPKYMFTGILPPAGIGVDELVKAAEADMGSLEGVETEVRYGAIDPDLAEFSSQVDLLVIGSRSFGPAMRLIEGSTSRHLLRSSLAPLLVVPREPRTSTSRTSKIGAASRRPAAV